MIVALRVKRSTVIDEGEDSLSAYPEDHVDEPSEGTYVVPASRPVPAGIQLGCPVLGRPARPSVDAPRRPRATCTSGRGGRSHGSLPCHHGSPSCAA